MEKLVPIGKKSKKEKHRKPLVHKEFSVLFGFGQMRRMQRIRPSG